MIAFRILGIAASLSLGASAFAFAAGPLAYPPAPQRVVTDTYFGTTVADPYRWLEDPKSPEVRAWATAETKLTRAFLDAQPTRAAYAKRVTELNTTSTERFGLRIRGTRWIYFRLTPPQAQPVLVSRDGLAGAEHVIFDPASMKQSGTPPAVDSTFLSPDGSRLAFTTQFGGSEDETLRVVDTATGALSSDVVAHAGGGESPVALTWDADGKGFLRTQWPKNADGSYATAGILIYHHVLGTDPTRDTYVFGKGLSPRAEYRLATSESGDAQAISVADGDGVHATVYVRRGGAAFARVATPEDAIGDSDDFGGTFVGDELAVISKKRDSRGEVVAIGPGQTFATGRILVPASPLVIEGIVPIAGGFMTRDVDGGDGAARLFGVDGTLRQTLPIPKISTVTALAGDPQGGSIVIGYFDYTTPNKWLLYDPATNAVKATGIETTSKGDFSNIVAERVFVPSLDGKVKIPLEIVRAKNAKTDGTAPTILTAYGAYGTISRPGFNASLLAWLEHGGVFAQAMIRGGGEYGEAWHQAARLETKTTSSDDVAACAKWLGSNGFGTAKHLGIDGVSAGGFLMGLALTRDPGLYRAVLSEVGIYDLLRVELTPNGAFNTPEFGTVKDATQFPWMLQQSPYHRVVRGRAYPAVMMTTGENDPRVDPYMSRKMIARLQTDNASPYPILLLQRSGEGHGIGNSFDQRVANMVDRLTFFESQLR